MTLSKQLWMALTLVVVLAFGGTFVISMLSARDYLEEQLKLKNQDNAAALALTLSQLDKDAATLELVISAQFDSGHYRSISLIALDGHTLVSRSNPPLGFPGPAWLPQLFPINVDAGFAEIQDGWNPFAQLTLQSDSSFAYLALWDETCHLAYWFSAGLFLCGIVGSVFLKKIISPLSAVVSQAEAIGDRRFIQIPLPGTLEFRRVVSSMNCLSDRVQKMLAEEAARLDELKRKAHYDDLTGILLRQPFLNQFEALLCHEDESSSGSLVFGRIVGLDLINRKMGRDIADQLLRRIGENLRSLVEGKDGWFAGRIGGADFALLVPGHEDALSFARELSEQLHLAADEANVGGERLLPVGATIFAPGENLSQVLSRADGALITAERDGGMAVQVADPRAGELGLSDLKSWQGALQAALKPEGVMLANYPVIGRDGQLLHEECPVRVKVNDEWQPGAVVIPWVARLGLLPLMDGLVVEKAMARLLESGGVGIHVSAEALCDDQFRDGLSSALRQSDPDRRGNLWIEIPESGAFRHLEQFRALCAELKPFNCRIGLEHVGTHLARLGQLHDLGIDFIKIDSSLIRDIEQEPGEQALVRGLCTIAHSIGLMVIAEGVKTAAERELLPQLGLDGMTGPGIRTIE